MLLEFTHSNFELHFHIKTGLKILSFMVEMLNESINWVWWSRERKMTSPSVVQLSNRATYKHAEERVTFWWCESCSWQKIITNNYCCANHTISKSLLWCEYFHTFFVTYFPIGADGCPKLGDIQFCFNTVSVC